MNFGYLGYFAEFFSGILVYHYPPWPTLISEGPGCIPEGSGEMSLRLKCNPSEKFSRCSRMVYFSWKFS